MDYVEFTSSDFKALFYKIKRRLFETSFMHKYGTFFDILIYAKFPYIHWESKPYNSFINKLVDSWNEFGGCDAVYNEAPCEILFSFYNRFSLLENHLTNIPSSIPVIKGTTAEQFRYIFIDYLYASEIEEPYSP